MNTGETENRPYEFSQTLRDIGDRAMERHVRQQDRAQRFRDRQFMHEMIFCVAVYTLCVIAATLMFVY